MGAKTFYGVAYNGLMGKGAHYCNTLDKAKRILAKIKAQHLLDVAEHQARYFDKYGAMVDFELIRKDTPTEFRCLYKKWTIKKLKFED